MKINQGLSELENELEQALIKKLSKELQHKWQRQSIIHRKKKENKMKNKLTDLNNHLFAQLERLNDEDLKGDKLDMEMKRAKSISGIANNIINNGKLMLDSKKYFDEMGGKIEQYPEVLKIESGERKKTS